MSLATRGQITFAIRRSINALPSAFPFDISIASRADRFDVLALVNAHCGPQAGACGWDKMLVAGVRGMERLRDARIMVLARRAGNLWALAAYTPGHDEVANVTAFAVDASLTLRQQLRAAYAITVPVHRAMRALGYTNLVSSPFPTDARMLQIFGAMRGELPMVSVAEHRMNGEAQPVSHWSINFSLQDALDDIRTREGLE